MIAKVTTFQHDLLTLKPKTKGYSYTIQAKPILSTINQAIKVAEMTSTVSV